MPAAQPHPEPQAMSAAKVPVFVAAGSNVDAPRNLARALAELARQFGALEVSPAYRNAAAGYAGPDFINLVVGFGTRLGVRQVIERLRYVEGRCARARDAPKWAPRTMDLDILLYGDLVCEEPDLRLPRPDLLLRAYMLGPLAEIAPGVVHPIEKKPVLELWASFDRQAHPLERVQLAALPASTRAGK
jgi:2-amino-4-hydroxy-6-hydroxymethyldihydropteridine diphosphokinase